MLEDDHYSTEAKTPSSLKYCLPRDELELFIDYGFIERVIDQKELSDEKPYSYLELKVRLTRLAIKLQLMQSF